ncbi:sigma-54-dependent transcriptional regulator [Campylobacter hyointestinalis]|uniref:Acetoacetate metabolism regulatory protein AtoC n=1 Tax=Campylobacter hyointestinalis subsp. hyointestinalis TaxID=91352 RepID=A0A855NAH5_CAMHY|nr:sigma-54 dependent transcriptional regulator [Campylobacter hyointestinalis]ANE33109.1 sigma54-dependent response regulator [Campylobacter hyointestinalis subsp. hyointestinalis LMG 9260]KEA44816.1 ATPase AAA [Campylobacter hyointestinalis subsp. hyointestinalis]MDL2346433.1 sigma-54 dependent transcriptional regulator [Campylobacter hyointestinalis]MDL2348173.1 sigma-54 dependent transcriptional regulator [Campylobacter hyointestinalis]MDL2349918.1 sigma-54 dependent transcriptional regula
MNIVIVEDDINMRKSLEIALGDYDEFNVKAYKSALEALKKLDDNVDIIVTDINMPGLDGLEFIKELGGKFDVIIMTGNATLSRAIESVRLGVKDFLTKPFDVETLVTAIKRTKVLSQKQKVKKEHVDDESSFIGNSPNLQKVLDIAAKAARTDVSVMIMGESGVGKELFANFIHKNSKRKNEPFMAINMAAIPENLLESELYGYEKGAFTDATSTKKGLFELANGGTLFLDEIGEMPINLQPKLLRALQEREIVRVGASKPIKIDVRIVCATNANLQDKIKNGEFREDLFYRLNTVPLLVPPLRERRDEILSIALFALKKACDEYSLGEKSFDEEALNELKNYDYPGNIRELISIVERAAILSDGLEISKDDLFIYSKK